jgi:hypothetical protein
VFVVPPNTFARSLAVLRNAAPELATALTRAEHEPSLEAPARQLAVAAADLANANPDHRENLLTKVTDWANTFRTLAQSAHAIAPIAQTVTEALGRFLGQLHL